MLTYLMNSLFTANLPYDRPSIAKIRAPRIFSPSFLPTP
jgi:hypothetical protein